MKRPEKIETLTEALNYICENHAAEKMDILLSARLFGFLADLYEDHYMKGKQERMILQTAFSQGIPAKMAAAREKDKHDQQMVMARYVKTLTDLGLVQNAVEDVLWTYAGAMDWAIRPMKRPDGPFATLVEALAFISEGGGKNALLDGGLVLALLEEFLPHGKGTRDVLEKAFELGIPDELDKRRSAYLAERDSIINDSIEMLDEVYEIQPILAGRTLRWFSEALGWEKRADFEYKHSGKGYSVSKYNGPGGEVPIPAKIENDSVAGIVQYAFMYHEFVTSVILPEGITLIGAGAFAGCTSLESITIPASVTAIVQNMVFHNCKKLTVTCPEYSHAHEYCKKNNIKVKLTPGIAPPVVKPAPAATKSAPVSAIKCPSCKGEFTPPANVSISNCPFCGQSLTKPAKSAKETAPKRQTKRAEASAKVGDIIRFGGYDWRVLDKKDGKALLVSEQVLEERPYNVEKKKDVTWENCTLRKYLNGVFLNKLGAAKSAIAETRNNNPNNQWFGTPGGSATTDKVFLLSLDEVCRYFGDSTANLQKKGSTGTILCIEDENKAERIAEDASGRFSWWWLRSPGAGSFAAAFVFAHGAVSVAGVGVNSDIGGDVGGVRPAMWVNL
ncbi:MAG: leucine-rich repeat domain-containing protein [Oscillospiraceae bacterium]|nr:leucine-rich repeat domain-containing protein [Oscillospiraceae bacterium]